MIPNNQPMSRFTKSPVTPGKGVKSHETSGRQEGKQGGQKNHILFLVPFPLRVPFEGIGRNSNPLFCHENLMKLTRPQGGVFCGILIKMKLTFFAIKYMF